MNAGGNREHVLSSEIGKATLISACISLRRLAQGYSLFLIRSGE
jgi:hypothetical protein